MMTKLFCYPDTSLRRLSDRHESAAKTGSLRSGLLVCFVTFMAALLPAQNEDGMAVLQRIDENLTSENRIFEAKMIVHGRRGSRTMEFKAWTQGEEKSFTEYLAPARERGTKMLKLGDRLWMYSPSTDRTIQISGHMLRQSVMGSDLSYEDMMEDPRLSHHYGAEIAGSDTVDGRACLILALSATDADVAYFSRKIWVDRERYIPLREELFARSGKMLKRTELKEITQIENRWFPRHILYKDVLKRGKGTEFIIEKIDFDVEIPGHIFSKAVLRR